MADGTMQQWPLTVSGIIEYAARWHPEQEVACKTVEVRARAACCCDCCVCVCMTRLLTMLPLAV
jgi:hypothetical protein